MANYEKSAPITVDEWTVCAIVRRTSFAQSISGNAALAMTKAPCAILLTRADQTQLVPLSGEPLDRDAISKLCPELE